MVNGFWSSEIRWGIGANLADFNFLPGPWPPGREAKKKSNQEDLQASGPKSLFSLVFWSFWSNFFLSFYFFLFLFISFYFFFSLFELSEKVGLKMIYWNLQNNWWILYSILVLDVDKTPRILPVSESNGRDSSITL